MVTNLTTHASPRFQKLHYLPLAGSIASSLIGVWFQQIILACLPLYLNLALIQVRNRQRDLAIAQQQGQSAPLLADQQQQLQQQLHQLQIQLDQCLVPQQTVLTKTHLQPLINQIHQLQIANKQLSLGVIPQLQQQLDAVTCFVQDQTVTAESTTAPVAIDRSPAIFIDAANLEFSARDLNLQLDYIKFYRFLTQGIAQPRVFFYTGKRPGDSRQRQFLDWLTQIGYQVITKKLVRMPDGTEKANLDVNLALDMYRLANTIDRAVLVSGDGDFTPAVRLLQQQNIVVDVMSFRSRTSKTLSQTANRYFDLEQRQDKICATGINLLTTVIPKKLQSAS